MTAVLENGWMETANRLVTEVHNHNKYMTTHLLFLYQPKWLKTKRNVKKKKKKYMAFAHELTPAETT